MSIVRSVLTCSALPRLQLGMIVEPYKRQARPVIAMPIFEDEAKSLKSRPHTRQ